MFMEDEEDTIGLIAYYDILAISPKLVEEVAKIISENEAEGNVQINVRKVNDNKDYSRTW